MFFENGFEMFLKMFFENDFSMEIHIEVKKAVSPKKAFEHFVYLSKMVDADFSGI